MASTVWVSRENPLSPGDLEVVQFDLSGNQIDVVNISGYNNALIAATFDTLVVVVEDTIFTYDGSSLSSYSLPPNNFYAGPQGLSLHSRGFGLRLQHPTSFYRSQYYESADGYSWTLKTPGTELLYASGDNVQYEFSTGLNAYVLNPYGSNETVDQFLQTTTTHDLFNTLPMYSETILGDNYTFGPYSFIISGADIFYCLANATGAPYIPAKVAKVSGGSTLTTYDIVGMPSGYEVGGSHILYDYDGILAIFAVTFDPTYTNLPDGAIYKFNGSTFARDRVYIDRVDGGWPAAFDCDVRRDLRSGGTFISLSTESCAAGAFRIYQNSSYVEVAGDPNYIWRAGAIAFLPSSAFWTRKIRCVET